MKKLLGIVVLGLLLCNVGFAEIRKMEDVRIINKERWNYDVVTVCVDGYKFVIVPGGGGNVVPRPSIVQAFEERDGKSLPEKC